MLSTPYRLERCCFSDIRDPVNDTYPQRGTTAPSTKKDLQLASVKLACDDDYRRLAKSAPQFGQMLDIQLVGVTKQIQGITRPTTSIVRRTLRSPISSSVCRIRSSPNMSRQTVSTTVLDPPTTSSSNSAPTHKHPTDSPRIVRKPRDKESYQKRFQIRKTEPLSRTKSEKVESMNDVEVDSSTLEDVDNVPQIRVEINQRRRLTTTPVQTTRSESFDDLVQYAIIQMEEQYHNERMSDSVEPRNQIRSSANHCECDLQKHTTHASLLSQHLVKNRPDRQLWMERVNKQRVRSETRWKSAGYQRLSLENCILSVQRPQNEPILQPKVLRVNAGTSKVSLSNPSNLKAVPSSQPGMIFMGQVLSRRGLLGRGCGTASLQAKPQLTPRFARDPYTTTRGLASECAAHSLYMSVNKPAIFYKR